MAIRKIGAFIEIRAKVVGEPQLQYVRASEIQRIIPKVLKNQLISSNPRNGQVRTIRGSTLQLPGGAFDCYDSPEDVLAACNAVLALEIMAEEGATS